MPVMHAWREFTNSVTVQFGRFTFATIHEQPFPFPHCCGCGFSGPMNGLARGVVLQHDSTIAHSARKLDSFSSSVQFSSVQLSSVQWVLLTCRHNSTSACYKANTKHGTETAQIHKSKTL